MLVPAAPDAVSRARALRIAIALVFLVGCSKPAESTAMTATPTVATATATAARPATTPATASPPATGAKTYQTRGIVKAFGEGRKMVKISHEDIPGYMKAMTMPFAVSAPSVLEGMKEGDAVEFSFTEESDGRLLIQSIKKR